MTLYYDFPLPLPLHHCSTIPSTLHEVLPAMPNQSAEEGQTAFFLSPSVCLCVIWQIPTSRGPLKECQGQITTYQQTASFNAILS